MHLASREPLTRRETGHLPEYRITPTPSRGVAEIKSESVADLVSESVADNKSECLADLRRNTQ